MKVPEQSAAARAPFAYSLHRLFGGPLLLPVRSFVAAILITAGPWLVAVAALAVVSVTMEPVMGQGAVQDLRLTLVYAFCLAPLAAGPIGTIAARLIRSSIEEGHPQLITETLLIASAAAGVVAVALALLSSSMMGIGPSGIVVGFLSMTSAAALLWVSFAVLSAIRSFAFLISAFIFGMLISIAACVAAARFAPTTESLIWSFTIGIILCVALTLRHVAKVAGNDPALFASAATRLLASCRRQCLLLLGVGVAICAVWIDKWVFWFSEQGQRTDAGFRHFADYDSVMFLAHLSIIPSFAALHLLHQTQISEAVRSLRQRLTQGCTYAILRGLVEALGRCVWSGVFRILFIQVTCSAAIVLMSPFLVQFMDFSFQQFLMLQVGTIGAFLFAFFYLCCSVLILAGQIRVFLVVQVLFLLVNLILSLSFLWTIGITAYAFLLSSTIASIAAFVLAHRALLRYDYFVFISGTRQGSAQV